MAVFRLARYQVRPEARDQAERAMHDYASYVRRELAESSWTTYRDPRAPTHYLSLIRADDPSADQRHRDAEGTRAFEAALAPLLAGEVEETLCELVTSSDLQRRTPTPGTGRPRSRSRR